VIIIPLHDMRWLWHELPQLNDHPVGDGIGPDNGPASK